jgi:hypothetical protein
MCICVTNFGSGSVYDVSFTLQHFNLMLMLEVNVAESAVFTVCSWMVPLVFASITK